jgi:hypothetical protein
MLKTLAFAAFAGALSLTTLTFAPGQAQAAPTTTGLILPAQATADIGAGLIEQIGYRRHGHYRRVHYRRPVYHHRFHHRRAYYRPAYYGPVYAAPVYYGRGCRVVNQQVWNGWGYVWQPVRVCRRHW